MKLTYDQIRDTIEEMKRQGVPPVTLSTQKMVRLANQASPYGERFFIFQKVYRVETTDGSFVVSAK